MLKRAFLAVLVAGIVFSSLVGTARAALVVPAIGAKKVAVVLFNFLNNPNDRPISTEQAREVFFTGNNSLSTYLNEVSNGKIPGITGKSGNVSGDIFGWYTISHLYNTAVCQNLPSLFSGAATVNAFFSGVNLSGYDHIFFIFKVPSGCQPPSWGGQAVYNDWGLHTEAWINAEQINTNESILAHEFLHSLGISGHANRYSCSPRPLDFKQNCLVYEYGDAISPLGSGEGVLGSVGFPGHPAGFVKLLLGWLSPASHRITINGNSADGTYIIRPQEKLFPNFSTDFKLIQIPNVRVFDAMGGSTSLYVEYRQPILSDASFANTFSGPLGVRVYLAKDYGVSIEKAQTPTLAINPTEISSFLNPGQSLIDPVTGIKITTLTQTVDEAKIEVKFPEVTITSPAGGATISNTTPISIKTVGAFNKLVLRGNNVVLTQFDYNPNNPVYNYTWNTGNLSAGPHQLSATMTNSAGTELAYHVVTLTKESTATISIEKVALNSSGALNFNGYGILRVNLSSSLHSPKLFIDNREVTIQPVVGTGENSHIWWSKISDVGHGLKVVRATALTSSGTPVSSEVQFFFNDLSVQIASPVAGTRMSGTWGIGITKTRGELDRFRFFVDDQQVADTTLLNFNLNTREFPNGPHTLKIKAFGREAEIDAYATPFPAQPLVVYFDNNCANDTSPCEEGGQSGPVDTVPPGIGLSPLTFDPNSNFPALFTATANDSSGVSKIIISVSTLPGQDTVCSSGICSKSIPPTLLPQGTIILVGATDGSATPNSVVYAWKVINVGGLTGGENGGRVAIPDGFFGTPVAGSTGSSVVLTFTANPPIIKLGQSSALSWQSSGVTSCAARSLPVGVWGGTQSVSGTKSLTPTAPGFYTLYLDCRNQDGLQTITRAAALRVDDGWVELKANGYQSLVVKPNQNVTLSWTSDKVTTCAASDAWSGTKPATGSATVMPTTRRSVYRLICTGPNGAVAGAQAIVTLSSTINHLTSSTNLPTQNIGSPLALQWQSTDIPASASVSAILESAHGGSGASALTTISLGLNDGAQTIVLPNTLPSGDYRLYLSATFNINNTPVTIDQRDLGGNFSKPLSFAVNNAAIPPSSGSGSHPSPGSGGSGSNNPPPSSSGSSGQDSSSGSSNPPSSPPANPPPNNPPPATNYTITIDAPRAGDSWRLGEQRDIRWHDTGLAAVTYQISLISPNGSISSLAQTSDKRYRWLVGPQVGSGYQISVRRADGAGQATSDSFTIAPNSHSSLNNLSQLAGISGVSSLNMSAWLRDLFPRLFP